MSETKKTRVMSVKRFIKGPPARSTAEGYLAAHREWLRTHSFLSPILDAYDQELILPTPTLQAVQSALVDHLLIQQSRKQVAKALSKELKELSKELSEDREEGATAAYTVSLYIKGAQDLPQLATVEEVVSYRILTEEGDAWVDTKGQTDGYHIMEKKVKVSPAVWNAGSFGEAMNLADRRLFGREDSLHAVIENTQGIPIKTEVPRQDALARILRAPKGAAQKGTGKTSSSLKWIGRAKQDRASFSHG